MHINLRQLKAFKAVMRCNSITIAAEFLNISQPSVSNLISNLEQDIGFALFERHKGRINPTTEAHRFYDSVEKGLMGLDAVAKAAHEIEEGRVGHLRVASFQAPSMSFLPKVVKAFASSHPDLSIYLGTENSRRINEWVAIGHLDLGIGHWPAQDPALESEPIKLSCLCVMPETHRLSKSTYITPNDLDNEPFIATVSADLTHSRLKRAFDEAGANLRVQFECHYFAVSCALVAEGVGVSIVDPFTAKNFENKGVIIREFRPDIPFEMSLLTMPKPPELVQEFAAHIKSCARAYEMKVITSQIRQAQTSEEADKI